MKKILLFAAVAAMTSSAFAAEVKAPECTVNPANGATVESLSYMTFNWGPKDQVSSIEAVKDGVYGTFEFNGKSASVDRFRFQSSSANVRLDFLEEYTADGTFSWTVAAGTYRITFSNGDTALNDAMSGVVNVGTPKVDVDGSLQYAYDPAQYSEVSELKQFSITFESSDRGAISSVEVADPSLIFPSFNNKPVSAPVVSAEGTKVTVSFETPVVSDPEGGDFQSFTCMIEKGAFKVNYADNSSAVNDFIGYTLIIKPAVEVKYEVADPAPGEYDEYPEVTLKFDDCTGINIIIGASPAVYAGEVSADNENRIDCQLQMGANPDEVVVVPIKNADLVVPDAVYSLVIPAGSMTLTIGGKSVSNDEIVITDFKVVKVTYAPEAQIALADGKAHVNTDLSNILVTVPVDAELNPSVNALLYKEDSNGEYSRIEELQKANSFDYTQFYLVCLTAKHLEDGNYRIVLPKDLYYCMVDGKKCGNAEQTFDIIVSEAEGIAEIGEDLKEVSIYNVNGVKVNAPAKGLYIVNGRKVIIK